MRRVFIPDELASQIDSVRGETSFETWLALAISEKVFGSRLTAGVSDRLELATEDGWPDEIYVALIDNEERSFLLWRVVLPQGQALVPVVVFSEDAMKRWEEVMGLELNVMYGPAIAWRHFSTGEFVRWLRPPAVEDDENAR